MCVHAYTYAWERKRTGTITKKETALRNLGGGGKQGQ